MEVPRSIGPIHWCLACPRAHERRIDIGFTVPNGVGTVIVQIHNGADDVGGDLGVEVMISDPNGRVFLSTRSRRYSWEEFRCSVATPGQYFGKLRGLNTPTNGTAPGNGGSLKVLLK